VGLERRGREGVHVDDGLEGRLLRDVVVAVAHRRRGAHERSPGRRERVRGALGDRREPIAVVRGLAAEGDHPAGGEHAAKLAQRGAEVGQVVQDRVAEDDVEAVVFEGQARRFAAGGLRSQAEALRGGAQDLEHAGRDVGRHVVRERARAEQVEAEVTRARTDLQPARVVAGAVAAERPAELAEHLRSAARAVVDAPLLVVAPRREIVVAGVGNVDLGRGRGRRHGAREA